MLDSFAKLSPVVQVLIATTFTWAMTGVGAASVFFTKGVSKKFLEATLGFAAGVMIAACCWSLLMPAIEMSKGAALPSWFPAALGFIIGIIFISGLDKILPHLHVMPAECPAEGIKTSWRRSVLLILAITLHNLPEGLAIGVVFGAIHTGSAHVTLPVALALTIGLGLQNLPEGMAVSFPLCREGMSRWKSFFYGQLSAIVEPIGGVIGVVAVASMHSILPYASGFAAGAMMFVVVEELIPESQQGEHTDLATMGAMLGFVGMMILDVAFS